LTAYAAKDHPTAVSADRLNTVRCHMRALRYLIFLIAMTCATGTSAAEIWPLKYEGKSTNDFIWDERTTTLVKLTIPDRFVDDLLAGLGGPPDPVYISANRYFSASACVAHACLTKSLYWYDTKTGDALGAIIEAWDEKPTLTLSSRTVQPNKIPVAALSTLRRWLSELELAPKSVVFFENDGKKASLDPLEVRPVARFTPPSGGPSFDCTLASTAIEREICRDSTLSGLDRDLSQLYREIYNGNSTTLAREELSKFQISWLRSRDASCEHSRAIHECLINSYMTQHRALMNWIPSR